MVQDSRRGMLKYSPDSHRKEGYFLVAEVYSALSVRNSGVHTEGLP